MSLDEIHRVILERKEHLPPGSYVASLFQEGKDRMLRKIGEEAAEVIIAAKNSGREQLAHEMADLWFHCMVLMAGEGLSHHDVIAELERRHSRKE